MADGFWDNLLGAGLQAYRAYSAIDRAKDVVGDVAGADARRRAAYETYANQMASLAPSLAAGYALKPATVQTGFASAGVDPTSGRASYTLDPRAQGMFDLALQGARSSLDLAGGFDPQAHAASRFAAQQALLAPVRAAEENKLLRELRAKGLLGVASHDSEYAGEGAVNPYMAALQGARARADAEAAYRSLDEGERYLDRLLGRTRAALDIGGSIDDRGMRALSAAGDWTSRLTGNEQAKTRATQDLMQRIFEAQRLGAYDSDAEARLMQAKAGAAKAKQSATDAAIDRAGALLNQAGGIGGVLKSVGGGLGGVLKNIGSIFGGGSSGFDYAGYDFGPSAYDYDLHNYDYNLAAYDYDFGDWGDWGGGYDWGGWGGGFDWGGGSAWEW